MDLLLTCERVITSVILDIVVITSWNDVSAKHGLGDYDKIKKLSSNSEGYCDGNAGFFI
ncbi:Uncharacterised protein [Yersinia kristensenii]|nr:Uncharacterised protein [Yersinia kristensenii]CNK82563.1 Uncharacterised protein [Yersinia kristensenii]